MDQGMFERLGRPVELRVLVSAATSFRLRALLGLSGQTREQAVGEAIRDWTLRREAALRREQRLGLERQLQNFGGCGEPVSKGVDVMPSDAVDTVQPMPNVSSQDIRERREALGLSRERMAFEAGISSASIEQFEAGARPKQSKALEDLQATLDRLERRRQNV